MLSNDKKYRAMQFLTGAVQIFFQVHEDNTFSPEERLISLHQMKNALQDVEKEEASEA